jgi:hypothetical protein
MVVQVFQIPCNISLYKSYPVEHMKQPFPPGAKGQQFTEIPSQSRIRSWLHAVLCAAGCLIPCLLSAQGFNLDWFTVAGGGGTSSGGNYVLSSTIGQPFVGETSGANYAVVVGFEGIAENLDPVTLPSLRIARTSANEVLVLWPASATGWVLQQSSTLGTSADWTDVSTRIVVNGTDNTVTLPLVAGDRFYRLRHP